MFRKLFQGMAALAFAAGASACAYMDDWEEVDGVPLAELDLTGEAPLALELSAPDTVAITQGEALSVRVEGDSAAAGALRFERDGNTLEIERDRSIYDGGGRATIRITMPAPAKLTVAGSGTIESDAMASEAAVEIAGSGKIGIARIAAQKLDVDIAGSGNLEAQGTVQSLSIDIAGSGRVRMAELVAEDVTIDIAGSGDVELASDGKVKADIAGSGDIRVAGSATCSVSTAGSGKLTCTPKPATATSEAASAAAD